MKRSLVLSSIALALALPARAQFTPIALDPASYNHDVVVEQSSPVPLSAAVNATMDGGTNKNGNTWYERGYHAAAPTTGVPVAGSTLAGTNDANHSYLMPPDYHTNNVILVGHSGGGDTPVLSSGRLTLTTPAPFAALSFLTGSGNGPVLVGYVVNYADSSTESNLFSSLDWFNAAAAAFSAAGRVNISGGNLDNVNSVNCRLFSADVLLGSPAVNVTSVDFYYVGSGANNNPNNNGRAAIFAISGSTDGTTYSPIAVTGFTYDAVMEADGPPTLGTGVAAASILTNSITATLDGGTSKTNNVWYEKGYYAAVPDSGLPAAGASVTSAWYSAYYTMPPSYAGNCAAMLASNVTSASIAFSTPAAYGALSFLGAAANGDTFLPCVINFQDGSTETNTVFVPDWFNRVLPWAYLSHGRVNPMSRSVNQTPDQFVDPFTFPYPFMREYRNLGLPTVRLFDAVINVTNTAPITNISLSFTNGVNNRVVSIFAVSGAPAGNVPPIFGASGTPTPGMPNNAPVNNISLLKRWEGTNNIVLSVTNIAGTGPISYQWKTAPRGGGLRDKMYSFDYSTFANVLDGGRISGANSSVLVISNALSADSADYMVVASNPYGAANSTVATLAVFTTNQSVLLGAPAGDVIASYTGESAPATESVDHAIDRVAQKWLSRSLNENVLPFLGPVGYVVTPVSGASIVTAMRFYVANDTQGRDPLDYMLEGSNDGASWGTITGGKLTGTLSLPTVRNTTGAALLTPIADVVGASVTNLVEVNFANSTGYKSYRVTITNTIDRLRQTLMQIAEIDLVGTFVPAPPVWVRQPVSQATVYVGSSPTFIAMASGLGALAPKYQWYRNGTTAITGATNSTYALPNAQLADSGATFHCVATNSFGQIISSSAALTVIPAPTESYPTAVLADNPSGYWRLNEGPDNAAGNNGVAAKDYRGARNGYYSNAVINVAGYNPASDLDRAGQFASLAPANSYVANINDVDFARAANSPGATFSVEAWVYGVEQTVDAAIVAKGYNGALLAGTGTGTEQFALDLVNNPVAGSRSFRFLVRDAAGNGRVALSTSVPYDMVGSQPAWRHLVGVCDQPNGKVYLYVDGLLVANGDLASNAGIQAQPLPMTIGARKSTGSSEYDNQWNGVVDDVAIYNSALSASQVLNHFYAAQRPPVITLQPVSQTTPENVSVTFLSAAYGPGTLSYQWYLSDGSSPTTAVAGQTASNLTFTTTAAQNGNMYQLVVANQYGTATGAVATLTVVSGPPSFFVDLPVAETVFLGHVIQLRVVPAGTAPFTYQWQKNDVNLADDYRISGSQSDVLTIGYANFADSGSYKVLVTGTATTPSTVDVVTVTNAIPITPFNAAGTGWTQGGTTPPIMSNGRLELTSGLGSTARAAFLNDMQNIGTFNASFVYQTVSGAGGADGATFCIQNATTGAATVGGAGGGLGYSGITPSVALAFNIYDPNTRGIRLLQNGTLPAAGAGGYSPITPVLVGGNANPIQVNVSYSGGVLTAFFRDLVTPANTFTTNFTVDIPAIVGSSSAFVGFTGADGGVVSTQVITNFTMSAPPVTMKAQQAGDSLVLSWPAASGAVLRSTPSLTNPVWTDSTATFRVVGTEARVTITPLTGTQFLRLDVYP